MPLVLVISSYVAASRVGGGIAPYVLGPMKVDPVLIPTCLFGRHPGWGPPGCGSVAADTMTKMLEGVAANNLFGLMDAVVTGYFSAPEQIAVACDAIDRIRATPRGQSHRHFPDKPIIVIDPVMGDETPGLYIKPETAAALMADLAPRADILAPNLWEFAKLTATDLASLQTPEDVAREARSRGGRWLISSIPSPAGIGVLYGKDKILGTLPPWQGGGDMIERVTFEKTTFKPSPQRFEAGTPAIAEAIGLAAALDYISKLGRAKIAAHEQALLDYATDQLSGIKGLTLYGNAPQKGCIISFNLKGAHPQDIGMLVDRQGVAIRVGHHCCMPLMDFLGVPGTCRASFALYNTFEEAEALVRSVRKAAELLA